MIAFTPEQIFAAWRDSEQLAYGYADYQIAKAASNEWMKVVRAVGGEQARMIADLYWQSLAARCAA